MTDIIFSEKVIDYLNDLSSVLMKSRGVRQYPDVATFAFFCRKSNINSFARRYQTEEIRLGRGTILHIAPSNVPVNFAYSLVAGLLAGNSNIVRVPSKPFSQVDLIENAINTIADNHKEVAERVKLVRYERGGIETDRYSAIANVRVIWGGDQTIANIRQSPLPARSFDITFADRYSLAVINAQSIIDTDDLSKLSEGFYNDTYLFDQNACTSPHLIVWLGKKDTVKIAQEKFWNTFYQYEKQRYEFQPIMGVDKLTAFYRQAIETDIEKERNPDNTLWRIDVTNLNKNIEQFRCTCGYFSEFVTENINEITPIIDEKYQTISYFGVEKEFLRNFVLETNLKGIDRIVPVGKTMDFDLIWDGYDLINSLSRCCSIE